MPIRARCLAACLLALPLALSALASPAAAAADSSIRLEPSPAMQNVTAGETAIFRVAVHNEDPLFDHNVAFTAVHAPPVNWTYSFNVTSVHVPRGTSANVTLLVNVPASFASTGTYNFTFRANESGPLGNGISAPAVVFVNVLPPPEEPATTPPPSEEPATPTRPALRLFAANLSVAPGATASTSLTLLNEGTQELSVELDIVGPASWAPGVELPFIVIQPGTEPRHVTLRATAPAEAGNGTTQAFTVQARAQGFTFETPWTVTVVAPPPASEPAQPSPTTTTQPTPRATNPPLGPALRFDFPQDVVEIVSGKTATAQFQVDNIGGTPLTLRLGGTVPQGWTPILFADETITLEPAQTRYVQFTMNAPAGLPAGGGGAARISVTADGGIYREAQFTIRIVEGQLDEETLAPTPSPTEDDAAATNSAGGEGILVDIPASWGLATGLGAVGAGALVLARRPWREKMLWGAIGLYTRLARPDVLGHDEREKLYRLIEAQPGTHFHALQRELGWNTGTLTYHIRVLERHGFVVSRRDGLYRRFYLQGAAPRKEVFNDGPTGLRADVLEAIRNQHGMSQTDLALALGANKQTVNYHVKALERTGMIRVEKRGRETFLYPATPGVAGDERARA